jgi:hypothetical protein
VINSAQPRNVFWQVGSSATLDIGTTFIGNILAFTSITLNYGASVWGRVLAQNGAVTMDTNNITIPPTTWDSYNNTLRTEPYQDDTFASSETTVFMMGTGFEPSSSYFVAYYDANGVKVGSETTSIAVSGILNSQFDLTTDKMAEPGIWHTLVGYTSFGIASYGTIIASPGTYGLVANDAFDVNESSIPELPTAIAGIFVAGSCGGIYWLMRKRRTAGAVRIRA